MPNIATINGNVVSDSGSDLGLYLTGSGTLNYLAKYTASGALGNSLVFDNGTNVGIGNTSPSAKLDVTAANGEIRSTGTAASYTQYNAFITSGVNMRIGAYATNNGFLGTTTNHPFTIETNNTERARFFANGNIGVNTTTDAGFRLDVAGTFRSTLDANINGLTVGKGGGSVSENTAIGVSALASITTANAQTAVGYLAGNANTTTNHNTFIGTRSGVSTTNGDNTFVGSRSGFSNTSGDKNTFIGTFAGYEVTTGNQNTFVGYYAGAGVTTGTYNIIIGKSTVGSGITTGQYNTIIGSQITGLSASLSNTIILADGQGNQRLVAFNDGNVFIGGSTSVPTNSGYKLDVNGTARVSGTELRLDNGTTGTINLYSATPSIRFFAGDPTGYSLSRSSTAMVLNSAGVTDLQISATSAIRIHNNRNIGIGTTTDAGFKLDVNGTARINGVLQFGAAPTLESFNGSTMLKLTASLGLTISSDRWNSNTSSSSYIQNGYTTKNFVTTNSANANFSSFDFTSSNAFQPTIANIYTQKLINGAMTINNTGANTFHGISISTTDNSASIANNVFAVYADATLGTNTSATRWAGYFVGRGYFSGNVGVGITSPSNSIHIDGGNATASYLQFTAGTTTGQTASDGFEIGINASGHAIINQQENLPMLFSTNNTERMRILSSGEVGIGVTTPVHALEVGGGIYGDYLKTTDAGFISTNGVWRLGSIVNTSGLTFKDDQYVEVEIDGAIYPLAIAKL